MKLLTPNNHIVAVIDNINFLIDTGSPLSFSFDNTKTITINNTDYTLKVTNICPKFIADGLTGIDIGGFIGMDIIRKYGITMDFENSEITFSAIPKDNLCAVPIQIFMNSYITTNQISINKTPLQNVIIDTGAYIPNISSRFANSLTKTGEYYMDNSPTFGNLSGELLSGYLSVNDTDETPVKFGTMPNMLDAYGMFDAFVGVLHISKKYFVIDFENNTLLYK